MLQGAVAAAGDAAGGVAAGLLIHYCCCYCCCSIVIVITASLSLLSSLLCLQGQTRDSAGKVQGADSGGAWAPYFASLTRVEDADAPFLWGEDEHTPYGDLTTISPTTKHTSEDSSRCLCAKEASSNQARAVPGARTSGARCPRGCATWRADRPRTARRQPRTCARPASLKHVMLILMPILIASMMMMMMMIVISIKNIVSHAHTYVYEQVYVYTCMYVCMYVCIYIYIYTRIHV